MQIEELWKRLASHGVDVDASVQRAIGLECFQERVLIRPPGDSTKRRVLEAGTSVPATYVARKLGVSVRTVQRYRGLLR